MQHNGSSTHIKTSIGEIEYREVGSGSPILFVHGGHGNCQDTLFQKGFDTHNVRLITPSRPGYGQTPVFRDNSPKDTADLFVSFLDTINVRSAIVIGISAGGLSAIELAASYPERVQKLVLISAVTKKWMTKKDSNYQKGKRLFSPGIERYSWALFRFFYAVFPTLMAKMMLHELSSYKNPTIAPDDVRELHDMIKKQRSHHGFVHDLDQDIDDAQIRKIACPTLILQSTNDTVVGMEHALHAKQNIQTSTLKTYDNIWGHLLWLGKDSEAPIHDAMAFIR